MNRFLIRIFSFISVIVLLALIRPLTGLYLMYKEYKSPRYQTIVWKRASAEKHTLVIGCSNLQHNIDPDTVWKKTGKNIDFLYFSLAAESRFLFFIKDHDFFKDYKRVILYLPYTMYGYRSPIPNTNWWYLQYASYKVSVSMIRHQPTLIFFDWKRQYDSVSQYLPKRERSYRYISSKDGYLDLLMSDTNPYRKCSFPFDPSRHQVYPSPTNTSDIDQLESLFSPEQEVCVLFTPVPDININKQLLSAKPQILTNLRRFNLLNEPHLLDSSLFHEQWYHLDNCGRIFETERFIQRLSEEDGKHRR